MLCFTRGCRCLAVVVAFAAVGAIGAEPKPDAKTKNAEDGKQKVVMSAGISQAQLAAKLALAGEKRKSPALLLAAAELLGELKDSPRQLDAKKEPGKKAVADKKPPKFDVHDLVDAALDCAKGDPKLSSFLEARRDQLASRGLIFAQGVGKKEVEIQGVTFKIIDAGVIAAGDFVQLRNVIFEAKKPAIVLVIGDGDGDLDLWVYDENTNGLIGKDTGPTSEAVVAWVPRYEGPFRVRVANVGRIAERYLILANW